MPEGQEPDPGASMVAQVGAPTPSEKVEYPCPGCTRTLRVRREFFGSTIVCKHCGQQFVPRASATNTPPEGRADERDARIQTLSGAVEATRARLDALDSASAGRDEKLAVAIGDLGRLTSDLMAVRLALTTLGDDVVAVRNTDSSAGVIESARRVVLDEVARLFDDERRRQQERLEPLHATLDRLQRTHQEFADQHAAALTRSEALGSRLDALDAAPRVDAEHAERLDRLDSAWRDLAAGTDALREESVRLRERVEARDSLEPVADSPAFDEVRAACDALRAEQEAFRSGLADHEARRQELEATIARLEAARAEDRREESIRWQDIEAVALGRYQAFEADAAERRRASEAEVKARFQAFEVEISGRFQALEAAAQGRWDEAEARASDRWASADRLHAEFREAHAVHCARLDRLDTYASRVDTLEIDAESARQIFDAMRDQHAETRRELSERLRAFEAEFARLREVPATRTLGPQPAVVVGPVAAANPTIRTGPLGSATQFDAWPDLDSLIEDLAHERTGGEAPPVAVAPVQAPAAPQPAPIDPAAAAKIYAARRGAYYAAMNASRFAEAIPQARFLVDLTRGCSDVPNLDHALWLRNLGIALSVVGESAEARSMFEAALAICDSDAEPAQVPRLMCLFDLVEFCLNQGDRWEGLNFCERALNLMTGVINLPPAVQQRADACLDRIQAMEGAAAGDDPLLDPTSSIVATA